MTVKHTGRRCTSVLVCALLASIAWAQAPVDTQVAELIKRLSDQDSSVRRDAAVLLGSIGPEARRAVPALIEALKDDERGVRGSAARALGRIGPDAKGAVPALIEALKDTRYDVGGGAALALGGIGAGAVPALIEALKDDHGRIRSRAAAALGKIGPDAKGAVPALIEALQDHHRSVVWEAASALGRIGADAKGAVPALIETLRDDHWRVREEAARALGMIGPDAKAAVPALIEVLKDDHSGLRRHAPYALGRIGAGAVPALIEALKREDARVRSGAADALAGIGPEVVPTLIEALKDDHGRVRSGAGVALGKIGPKAKAAVPVLIEALKDGDGSVRFYVAIALAGVGPDAKAAVPALIEALKDDNDGVRRRAADALAGIGREAKAAVPALIEALKDDDPNVRSAAAGALGRIGPEAKAAVPGLIDVFEDQVRYWAWPWSAAVALGSIAQGLEDSKDIASLPDLEEALQALTSAETTDPGIDALVKPVRRAVEALRAMDEINRNRWYRVLFRWALDNRWYSGIAAIELGLLGVCLILLCFSPITLLIINEGLDALFNQKMKISYKGFEGSAPVRLLLVVGFFHYHRRVLDAWVDKHIDAAQKQFNKNETVVHRQTHVPIPVVLDDNSLPSIGPEQLRQTCKRSCWRVLIHGEGGAGKTSLACQMGHWAIADDKAKRLCEHRMLPTLIEHEIDLTVGDPRHRFREAIRGQLQDLVGEAETISPVLLEHLLRKQRVLVIVDQLSEMSEDTRRAIRPGDPEFLPYALVVTSRMDEKLDAVRKTIINPCRIDGNRLSSFMESYLTQLGKRGLFDDAEYFEACRKLSVMVAERDITVLLAKLYADQMVAVKAENDDSALPDNIPDLMLQYLKILNRDRAEDDPDTATVQGVAKLTAWQCLRRTYRPGPAVREDILDSLQKAGHAQEHLKYLERRLRIIRTTGVSDEKVLFELDPLAEYLAGLHLVELHRDDEGRWGEFFSQADTQPDAPESIRGFLLAVRDCCLAKNKESDWTVPELVLEELDKRAGLDPNVLRQAHLRQRIQRLIINLNVHETDDRAAAAKTLGSIGSDAKDAVPALCEALKDGNVDVRRNVAVALASIGSYAKAVVAALIEALKDEDHLVRRNASKALRKTGPAAKASVPTLIEALKDENHLVRHYAAVALGRIGPDARTAVPSLCEALADEEDCFVVHSAAEALGSIGPDAKAAVPALTEALKDESHFVRRYAAVALGRIGPDARTAVPALAEALKDCDGDNRQNVAKALARIGSCAEAAVPALIEALKDGNGLVRHHAAVALGRIGPDAKAAVPALTEALNDRTELVRKRARETLMRIDRTTGSP